MGRGSGTHRAGRRKKKDNNSFTVMGFLVRMRVEWVLGPSVAGEGTV